MCPDDSQTTRPGRWPSGLLGMLCLVVGVEAYVLRHEYDRFLWVEGWDWRRSASMAGRADSNAEILCFGDSQVKWGVAPLVLEETTGHSSYNLSMCSGQAPASYFLLKRILDRGKRPRAILVDYFSPLLVADPWKDARHIPEVFRFGEIFDLAWVARDASFFGNVAATKLLPSLRTRLEVREELAHFVRLADHTHPHRVPPKIRRNLDVNKGGMLEPSRPLVRADFDRERGAFPADWSCHPVQRAFVERFLELAGAHEIPVFWLIPPMSPELQGACEESGNAGRYDRFVRETAGRYRHVTVVDGRRGGYEPSDFIDWIHLARDGSARFSAEVATVVGRRLDGEEGLAWVVLPDSRGRRIDLPLEDLEQSRAAIAAGAASSRRR